MDFIGGLSEISEASELKVDSGKGFSKESLDKYDKIMGDDKIDSSEMSEKMVPNLGLEEKKHKFDKLFNGDDFFKKDESASNSQYTVQKYETKNCNFGEGFKGAENEASKNKGTSDDSEKKALTEEEKLKKIQDFIDGKVEFDEVKDIFAEYYANAVNTNHPWSWNENIPGGDNLTGGQRKEIREYAREKGMVSTVPTYEKDGKSYADFSMYKVFECILNKEDWNKTDKEQFDKCNQMLKKAIAENPELAKQFTKEQLDQINRGETPAGYTWHHSEKDGTMQLVPYGVHNSTNHCGGRSEGNWADSPRQ